MRRPQIAALALAAGAGASGWISLGTIAVVNQHATRVGVVPPWWLLGALILGAMVASYAARLRLSDSWPLTITWLAWLPWLPWGVPFAALIWDGALEGLLWLAALAGVVISRASSLHVRPRWLLDEARAPWTAAAVFSACALASAANLQAYLPGGDEPHYLIITQSLLYDRDLQIENNHERGDYLEYLSGPIRPDFLRRGSNEQIYSVHAPGVSALVLPAYAVAGYPGAVVTLVALVALSVAGMWRIGFELTRQPAAAWASVFAVAFSATYFLHGFTIFPDPAGGAFVTLALLTLVRLEIAPGSVTTRHLMLAGVALAALPWLHTRFVLVAIGFGAIILARLLPARGGERGAEWTRVGAFLAIPAVSAALWFLFFWFVYGTPNPSAPYGNSRQNALEWIPAGLTGLAFDQQFGMIANAPALGLLPYALYVLWKPRPRLAIELLLIAVPYVLVVASFGMWWGGWSAPARFLTCLTPLAVPAIALLWAGASPGARSLLSALVALGVLNVGARVALEQGTLLYNFRDGFDLLLDWSSRAVNLPLAFPSVHRVGPGLSLQIAIVWALTGAVVLMALRLFLNTRRLLLGARWAITAWVVAIGGAAGMTAAWRVSLVRPLTPETSEIDFIHRWRPDRRPLAVSLPSARVMTAEAALGGIDLETSVRGRDVDGTRPMLALPWLPAGDYRVIAEGAPDLDGVLTVSVGSSPPMEEWSLTGRHAGDVGLRVTLPTIARSLLIRADPRATGLISRLALKPERVRLAGPADEREALQAARYATTRVFFLDDGFYMEPGGIWTRGDHNGEVVVDTDDGRASAMTVIAGPVAVQFRMEGSAGSEELSLQPGDQRLVHLAPGRWTLTTRGTFRPKDFDAQNQDARHLGARLEFRQ